MLNPCTFLLQNFKNMIYQFSARAVGPRCYIWNLLCQFPFNCLLSMYTTFRFLRSHGLSGASLWKVSGAYIIGRLTYFSPAWWGFCTIEERGQLEAVVGRMVRRHFLPPNQRPLDEIIDDADMHLFRKVYSTPHHVLATLTPPTRVYTYDLRERRTNLQLSLLPCTTSDKNFSNRIILKLNAP